MDDNDMHVSSYCVQNSFIAGDLAQWYSTFLTCTQSYAQSMHIG